MALPRTQIPTFRTRKQFCGSRMENFETCSDEAFIVNVTKISLEAPLKHGKTLEAALRDFRKDDAEKAYFTAIDTVFSHFKCADFVDKSLRGMLLLRIVKYDMFRLYKEKNPAESISEHL